MSSIVLYQFGVSHYCEKVRWALAHKRLPYKSVSMIPGLHIGKMKKMTGQTSVPVLRDGKTLVHDSSAILSYLDEQFPRFELTPEDAEDARQAGDIEAWADTEVGPAVRLLCYSVLLDYPDLLIPMFCHDGPWYGRFVAKRIFPKVRAALIERLPVNAQSVAEARKTLHAVIETFSARYTPQHVLVGERFSRADLAMASLWAPLFRMSKYGSIWPDQVPEGLLQLEEEFAEMRAWVEWTYLNYR